MEVTPREERALLRKSHPPLLVRQRSGIYKPPSSSLRLGGAQVQVLDWTGFNVFGFGLSSKVSILDMT